MLAGWALTTEREFETDLNAGATGTHDRAISRAMPRRAKPSSRARAKVRERDRRARIGGARRVRRVRRPRRQCSRPAAYGTSNLTGTAQASTLQVNVSGLAVVEAPYLPAGVAIFTNDRAAKWHEDGPFVATAEDVAKLGQNRAYWSMGATGIFIPGRAR